MFEPIFAVADFVLSEQLYSTIYSAESPAAEGYTRLLPKLFGPYPVTIVSGKCVRRLKNRREHIISVNRTNQASNGPVDENKNINANITMTHNTLRNEENKENQEYGLTESSTMRRKPTYYVIVYAGTAKT